jgi:hypothetical protein
VAFAAAERAESSRSQGCSIAVICRFRSCVILRRS